LTGRTLDIEYVALPADDPVQRCPDIARARRLLGWEPNVALKDGLRHTIRYCRSLAEPVQPVDVPDAVAAE
jgi:UDP-glucuronate decarboxylase